MTTYTHMHKHTRTDVTHMRSLLVKFWLTLGTFWLHSFTLLAILSYFWSNVHFLEKYLIDFSNMYLFHVFDVR